MVCMYISKTFLIINNVEMRKMGRWHVSQQNEGFILNPQGVSENSILFSHVG